MIAMAVGLWVAAAFGAAGEALADDRAVEPVSGFAFGGTGETIFEHLRASLRDPHFGMRFYIADKVPGTLSTVSDPGSADADARANAKGGHHVFWDVSFGERAPLVGWYDIHPTRSVRHARGFQLNVDAAAFLLVDFNAQSSAAIDTDYHIGLSADVRPWADGWDRLSLSVGFFHQSTHLGDEYVLSAHTIQAGLPPEVNPYLPYRANFSYLAFPAIASVDLGPESAPQYSARVYGGGTWFTASDVPAATHPEWRAGVELLYGPPVPMDGGAHPRPANSSSFLHGTKAFGLGHGALGDGGAEEGARGGHGRLLRRGPRSFMLAYEALIQRQFTQDPAFPGQPVFIVGTGTWVTHHAMAILNFNLDTKRSTSNALAISLEFLDGRNQHGQLIEYDRFTTGAIGLQYYW
jgi:hypothetical protein